MMHGNLEHRLAWACALLGVAALAAGCGDSDDGGSGAAGSGGGSGCSGCVPPPPENGVPGDGDGAVFAFTRLLVGDTLRDGVKDPNAWKQYGYDLDGIKSTKETTQHCQPVELATDATIKTDGEGGIDNSFGANLLPILEGIEPNLSDALNQNIVDGRYGALLKIEKIGGERNYVGLPASSYFARDLGHSPVWDGTDAWPLFCELMVDCQPSGTKQLDEGNESIVQFPESYVVDGTWVSGAKTIASISVTIQGIPVRLDIGQAVMTAELNDTNPPSKGTNGVLAGIIDTTHLIGTLAQLAGRLSTSLCDASTLESLKRNVRAASDIMHDGSQDPAAACDGISVGIGFDMDRAKLGEVKDALEYKPDPCEDM